MGGDQPPIDPKAFRQFEAASWEKKGDSYHRFFQPITGLVVDPLMAAAGVGSGMRVLDVATGPGYAAARADQRKASVVGVDFARPMVAMAKKFHPSLSFLQAEAEKLPFANGVFEAVVGNFIVPHLARPEQAAAEFVRVLAGGGRLALSTWDVPGRARIIGMFIDAVQEAGASEPPSLPPGPPFFRFSSDKEFSDLLQFAGLERIEVRRLSFTHRLAGPDQLWQGFLGGAVRTTALILAQTAEVQGRIRAAFDRLARDYWKDGGLEVPVSVKLASGQKLSN